ncbi:hypothetical protein RJ640_019948 [Escallonia rubra]|uniref:Pectinesterase catalytic domain-containing protein n=1 Tax=Escallonia rubra TaxID=112253 RepID=A0AA88Q9R2_9ASTE|nr:hypothetical protein RJ640_019948 [Escallonia rubra]
MYPRLPLDQQFNAITAQGRTDPGENTGISIQNCTIRAADDLASSSGTTQTYLGRPWKQYSRTIYMQSFIDGFINPLGWHEWPGFYIINATDAANFTVSSFLLGDEWLSPTGVPYTGSLL